jgi:hypothetical protein
MGEVEVGKGEEQTGERIERREAIKRLAMYTAPAMIAVLMSAQAAPAASLIVTPIVK